MENVRTVLKSSATTRPQDLAGAVAKYITHDKQSVEVVCIGAGSLNQAIKGLIIARRFIAGSDLSLSIIPDFRTIDINGKEVTAIVLKVNAD